MKISLDYRNPTPSHMQVAVFVNGALAGVLTLRTEEVVPFTKVILNGRKGSERASTGRAVGGNARAQALTPERRREIAAHAAAVRWGRARTPE